MHSGGDGVGRYNFPIFYRAIIDAVKGGWLAVVHVESSSRRTAARVHGCTVLSGSPVCLPDLLRGFLHLRCFSEASAIG